MIIDNWRDVNTGVFFASTINEKILGEGVAVDGVQLKDGNVYLKDRACVDDVVGAQLTVTATDTGSGTEDTEVRISRLVNGVMTDAIYFSPDGNHQVVGNFIVNGWGNFQTFYLQSGSPACVFRDTDCTDAYGDRASISMVCTDTGAGTEDATMLFYCDRAGAFHNWMTYAAETDRVTIASEVDADGVLLKDGNITTAGSIDAAAWITTQSFYAMATGSPGIYFRDTDANPGIDHAGLLATATDTTPGHEYINVILRQLVDGVLTDAVAFVADGAIALDLNRPFKCGPIETTAVQGTKAYMTVDGGIAVKLTNKTGGASVKGEVVTVYDNSAIDNAVEKIVVDVPNPIGVFYESGVADGAEAWVVVSGIADVYFVGNATRGHLARGFLTADGGSYVAGQALSEAVPSTPFASDKHFYEIGHVLASRTGAGLAKCVLHFN